VRIVIAGGGTGGHTSTGLAVARALRELAAVEMAWLGSAGGIESRRVPEAGLPFHVIPTGKLRRYWDWQNIPDLALRVPAGFVAARRLLRSLGPDLLFATGGFVSLPPAVAAWTLSVPVVIHEQTGVPGLANRLVGPLADRILLSFPAPAGGAFPSGRVTLTGNPPRPEVIGGSRPEGLRRLGLAPGAPLVYVTGGAQGAHRINRVVGAALEPLLRAAQVVHQCGDNPETGDGAWLGERARGLPDELQARYVLRPYIGGELAHVYAAADLVIGRSGAGTVTECCHLGLPAVYIPLPGASGDEQTVNARTVERAGGAVVLSQASLTAEQLVGTVLGLLADHERLRGMGARARTLAVPDAAERIARVLLEVASGRRASRPAPRHADGGAGQNASRPMPEARDTR
jgi:UDP-N-acetylglucosamine--N-acetylmuramyl-(pentapeptide) pyrophosphoryl-undecaprenol N-acetylglucosamine transferase